MKYSYFLVLLVDIVVILFDVFALVVKFCILKDEKL
jgi:hypothetical protein